MQADAKSQGRFHHPTSLVDSAFSPSGVVTTGRPPRGASPETCWCIVE